MRQTNNMEFKKLDINKALFERKMAKIMQEIEFYDEELNGLYQDSLEDQLEELEKIRNQNKQVHSKILQDLNKLVAWFFLFKYKNERSESLKEWDFLFNFWESKEYRESSCSKDIKVTCFRGCYRIIR